MDYDIARMHHQGTRPYQEDVIGYREHDTHLILAVVDGMGGLSGGKEAAEIIMRALLAEIPPDKAIASANRELLQFHERSYSDTPPHERPGAVGTFVSIEKDTLKAKVGHLGDTRLYHYRNNEITQVSKDQVNEKDQPTQDFGKNTPQPDFSSIQLAYDDILILATDGAYNIDPYPEDNFLHFLKRHSSSLKEFTREFEEHHQNDFKDNATLLIFRIKKIQKSVVNPQRVFLTPKVQQLITWALCFAFFFATGFVSGMYYMKGQQSRTHQSP